MAAPSDDPAATWGPRLCAVAPFVAVVSFVIGFLDPHGGENPLAASALAVAFVAVASGLIGLFTSLYATEKVPGFVRPRWAAPAAVGGIAGGFLGGIVGLIT
ncbi:MAG: hypothetical protein JNK02_06790 [Planctomycetes bacterium]|nr:hypothetical protein [Planctomycetota bacterium]